ncbi:hypothetical protein QFZ53_000456 [Microbacterium natoriense]|uniref:Uncharacterized protein n=1 Tax=Microbacterium natoriense TaxID=284570 RepID=A0AAW8ES41_9MICO|nr:hypothetical protein [Microbacterium natoriense]MDQ0646260.1 hypothetical protein [Microbacterium natoriense]
MDARATRAGSTGLIWGGAAVLAWAAFTLFTGGGSAHADEGDGPLDGLTGVVSSTVTAVTAPVTPVVTQVVAPVVTAIAAPVQQTVPAVVTTVTQTVAQVPVVGPATAPVVSAVTDTAQTVVQPVVDVVGSTPVSQVTTPVIHVVTGLPIVGDLVDDLGVPRLIDDVVGIVDDTTDVVGGVVEGTVPPVLEGLEPLLPAEPITPASPNPDDGQAVSPPTAPTASVGVSAVAVTSGAPARGPAHPSNGGSAGPDGDAPWPSGDPAAAPPTTPISPSSSAGSGGGAAATAARISDDGVPPLRAEKRNHGATDDALPTSPVADHDVAPD